MAEKLTDTIVKGLPLPATGNKITYDAEVKGFGVRVTAAGARAFVLNYRVRGRERRQTIGSYPEWKTTVARNEAARLKRLVDVGEDPMARIDADRSAKTVADLCDRFEEEHLPKRRESTQRDYRALIERDIRPAFKHTKVADLSFSDIDELHRKITRGTKDRKPAPYVANRTVAVLSKMLALAIKWGWRTDNPARGIERNHEEKRERYLSADELAALTKALAKHEDQQAANIIRMLLLTGARRGEVQAMKWADLDLTNGTWTKPASTTKQRKLHHVPLSAPARQLLSEIRAAAIERANDKKNPKAMSEYVFPGWGSTGFRQEIKHQWADLCREAGLVSARIHDLRHTYASVLASSGLSLPIIGALLGHSQPATTARYAHLMADPLRQATERAAELVTGGEKPTAEIVSLKAAK